MNEAHSLRKATCPSIQTTLDMLGSASGAQPILFQVGCLGPAYKSWVHRPAAGRPRFFKSSILEHVTKTPWWVVPLLWGPLLLFCLFMSLKTRQDLHKEAFSKGQKCGLLVVGFLLWQLLEYLIHRWVFHSIPSNYWGITAHFLFHGCHHKYPRDDYRLVFPPLPAAVVALAIYGALHVLVVKEGVLPLFSGIAVGYLTYDCLHYCMHHGTARRWIAPLRKAHLQHHFRTPAAGFGISTPLFDVLLSTQP